MTRTTAELRQYLAGEWLFDNDFKDTSGNGNHGTPTDVEWKPTLRGMKPRFNGSSSEINCGNNSSLDVGENSFTIFCYIQKNGNTDVLCKRVTASTGFEFGCSTDKISIKMKDSDAIFTSDLVADTTLTDGTSYCICATVDRTNDLVTFYLNGNEDGTSVITLTGTLTCTNDLFIGAFDTYSLGYNYSDCLFLDILTATEILNLYNETKGEYGVMPAEHSFTHNPDDVIDSSDAVGAWGTAKESTTELVDLSGNGLIATIKEAMPTEGFIQGRRFTAANENCLDCGDVLNIGTSNRTIISIFKCATGSNDRTLVSKGYSDTANMHWVGIDSNGKLKCLLDWEDGKGDYIITSANRVDDNKLCIAIVVLNRTGNIDLYVNGILVDSADMSDRQATYSNLYALGLGSAGNCDRDYYSGIEVFSIIYNNIVSTTDIQSLVNTLARLPFWSVNYTDYPDNVATYTDNLPYSSNIISSGTFKVDDDVLNCVSAGTITYRASYEFDGSEYIKVEIDGVEYAGTGTITQGNTTVSVAQGSNKITIVMGTADTIDKVRIQFREEV